MSVNGEWRDGRWMKFKLVYFSFYGEINCSVSIIILPRISFVINEVKGHDFNNQLIKLLFFLRMVYSAN